MTVLWRQWEDEIFQAASRCTSWGDRVFLKKQGCLSIPGRASPSFSLPANVALSRHSVKCEALSAARVTVMCFRSCKCFQGGKRGEKYTHLFASVLLTRNTDGICIWKAFDTIPRLNGSPIMSHCALSVASCQPRAPSSPSESSNAKSACSKRLRLVPPLPLALCLLS